MLKLIRFLKPYSFYVAATLALLFFQSLSELYLPTLMSDIVDIGILNGDIKYILGVGMIMLLVAAVGSVCTILAGFLSSRTAAGLGKNIRSEVFARAESFSLSEFDRVGTASLITRTTNDITQVQQMSIMMLRIIISAPMMCIGGIVMAVSKDPGLSLVIVVAIPILAGAIFFITGRGIPLFRVMQKKLDSLNRVLREGLTGIRVIRAFNRVDYERRRFDRASLDLASTAISANRIMASLMPAMMLLLNLTIISIIWFGGIRIDSGKMQIGDLMAFIQYVMQIMFSLIMVSMVLIMIPRASASAARINEVLDIEPEIRDPDRPEAGGGKRGGISFENVTFSYPGAEEPAVSNISFSARPGEVTAIIGGTGSGKSTLINLIMRFYDVDSGRVLIDGVDVRRMSQKSLRSKIGFVPQRAVLFTGTIADNVRFGKEDAGDDEVAGALEIAQAEEFVSAMKEGVCSLLGQGGANLSGGQKQRLSIARALVGRPEIYVFDDSFSALDFKTDARLREALKRETAGATVIIVAQRVSTIMDADSIIVLNEGRIAGTGTHQTLMKDCEVYREVVFSQLSEEETA
ncbi:MAG: ABC transporter ATP-binding protein [Bacillota bacterium]